MDRHRPVEFVSDALAPTLDDIDRRVSHAVQNRTGTAELLSPRGRLPSRVRRKVLVTRSAEYREFALEADAAHSLTPIDRYARSPASESTVLLLPIRGSVAKTRRMSSPVMRSSWSRLKGRSESPPASEVPCLTSRFHVLPAGKRSRSRGPCAPKSRRL